MRPLFTADAEIQKTKAKRQIQRKIQIPNTKIKIVGIIGCDCHVASLFAMTKRRKLLVIEEAREVKN